MYEIHKTDACMRLFLYKHISHLLTQEKEISQ